ncbi:MAG TPA: hypothetical protein VFV05_14495 [Methylomirabilota bacterium]|nr:hypothetical protein [Methylomirabilota bacterium]
MADDVKDPDNKDAEESGRPVQLDREDEADEMDQPDPNEQHGRQGVEHGGRKAGQPHGQNR